MEFEPDVTEQRVSASLPSDLDSYLDTYVSNNTTEPNNQGNGVEETVLETSFVGELNRTPVMETTETTPLLKERRRTVSFAEQPQVTFRRMPDVSPRFSISMMRARQSLTTSIKLLGKSGSLMLFQRSLILSSSLKDVASEDRKATAFMTSMNILCLIQGISIFAMPFVTVYGGAAVIVSTFIIGFLNWYTTYLLNECQHQESKSVPGLLKRVYPTYIEIGEGVFPKYGGIIMKLATLMTVVSGISFFILLGQTTYDLLKVFLPLSNQHWIIVWAAFVFPCLFVTRVSLMAWFSLIGLVSLTIVLLTAYGLLISQYSLWSLQNVSWGFNLEFLMLGYGIIHNSYFLHLVVPAIEGSMSEPKKCNKAMAISFGINTIFKALFQVMGALTYGPVINQSVTTNLSYNLGISFLINVLTAINLYCSFPISLCVLFEMMDEYMLPHFTLFNKEEKSFYGWLMLSRGLVVGFVIFVSVSVPQFGLVVSFLGNLRSTLLALIFPIYFYLYLKWRHISVFNKSANIFLLLFSALFGVGAAYYSLRAIVIKLSSD